MKGGYLFVVLLLELCLGNEPVSAQFTAICRTGYAHSSIMASLGNFTCKPGPATRPVCMTYERNLAEPFCCPDNGYLSGFIDTPPTTVEYCCTQEGLQRLDDCIKYETVQGEVEGVLPDRVIISSYSLNGGRTYISTQCRYKGYRDRLQPYQRYRDPGRGYKGYRGQGQINMGYGNQGHQDGKKDNNYI